MTLTKAQIAALKAVRDGKVFREYRTIGNVLYSRAGNGAKVLWALDRMKMIRDERSTASAFQSTSRQVLTKIGQDALHEAEWS